MKKERGQGTAASTQHEPGDCIRVAAGILWKCVSEQKDRSNQKYEVFIFYLYSPSTHLSSTGRQVISNFKIKEGLGAVHSEQGTLIISCSIN